MCVICDIVIITHKTRGVNILIKIIMFDTEKKMEPVVYTGDFGLAISRCEEVGETLSILLGSGNPASVVVAIAFAIQKTLEGISEGDKEKEYLLKNLFQKAFNDFTAYDRANNISH